MFEKKETFRIAVWVSILAFLSVAIVYSIIIPILLPALYSGLSGRAASLISVLIYLAAIFAILLNIFKYGNKMEIYSIPYFFPLLAFVFFSLLVNMLTPSVEYSRWVYISITLPVLYMVITASNRNYQMAELIQVVFIVGGSIVSAIMTFSDSSGNFPSLAGIIRHRGTAYFLGQTLGPVALANIAGLTFVCSLVMYRYSTQRWIKYLMTGTMLFPIIGLIVSGGRMAILAVIACLFLMIFVRKSPKQRYGTSKILWVAGIVVALIVIFQLANIYNQEIINRVARLPATLINYRADTAIAARIELWSVVLAMIKDHPFGLGFDTFFDLYGLSPHNEYLNVILGAGIQGLLAFLIFGFLVLRRCYRTVRLRTENYAVPLTAYMGGVFIAIVSLTGAWTYSNSITSLMIWTIVACGVSVSR